MIQGLSHMTFVVENLDRMEQLLVGVLGATRIYESGDEMFSVSPERFYDLGGLWVAVMQGAPLPTRTYNHVAFKIRDEDFDMFRNRIEDLGLEVRPPRPRIEGEGRSIYFYDHDNHLFELHTGTRAERLERYAMGRNPRTSLR